MKKCIKITLLAAFASIFCGMNGFADLNDTVPAPIPEKYHYRSTKAGTTELFPYATNRMKKTAVVYLPYGYDETSDKKYPVLFLMHGGGGTSANYLGPAKSPNRLCSIIDNAIMNKEIEPMIIVCPNDNGGFYAELRDYLLPVIEAKYKVRKDRNSRAIGGFSMGSVTTWQNFYYNLDLIRNYIPMSGDSWICGNTGGKILPDLTAQKLAEAKNINSYDFRIFTATGTADIAYPNLTPQVNAMKKVKPFAYTTKDFSKGNLIYYVIPGNGHDYGNTYEYIYNALKLMFPATQ